MYQYISGVLVSKMPTSATLETHGIGYQLTIPISTYQQLPEEGKEVKLLTHFVVREDAQLLFGFFTEEERELFRLLISVSGIGPKMAVTVLSGIGIRELRQAIVNGAVPVLTSISGIGKKTAERLVVELREKIVLDEKKSGGNIKDLDEQDVLLNDAIKALISLGYRKQNAKEAIQKVFALNPRREGMDAEELIRQSLKYI